MSNFKLKPTHAPVKEYYATLAQCAAANFANEGNVRRAFESLLEKCARGFEWFVVAEYPIPRTGRNPLKVNAAILDAFNLPRGYWEANGRIGPNRYEGKSENGKLEADLVPGILDAETCNPLEFVNVHGNEGRR